jgi:hypothetical protein
MERRIVELIFFVQNNASLDLDLLPHFDVLICLLQNAGLDLEVLTATVLLCFDQLILLTKFRICREDTGWVRSDETVLSEWTGVCCELLLLEV